MARGTQRKGNNAFLFLSAEEAERFSLPDLPLSCEPPPGCIPGHRALPILNQNLNQRHEATVKQEIDTPITGPETSFYYHGGRGRAVSLPPPPDDKETGVLNNCHSLQCGGGGHFPVFVWRGTPSFQLKTRCTITFTKVWCNPSLALNFFHTCFRPVINNIYETKTNKQKINK